MFVIKVACPRIKLYRGALVKSPVEPGLRTTAAVTAICMKINPGGGNTRKKEEEVAMEKVRRRVGQGIRGKDGG